MQSHHIENTSPMYKSILNQSPSATCLSISVSRHMNQQRLSLDFFVMGRFTTEWQQLRATNSTIKQFSVGSACESDHHQLSAWSDSMLLGLIMESPLSSRNGKDKHQCSTTNQNNDFCLMQSVGYKPSSTTHSALSLRIA